MTPSPSSLPPLPTPPRPPQVIPPGARAKFPLTLAACEIRSFTEKLEYCVNGSHVLDFSVSARVVPVTLDLSVEELNFEYGVDDWESFLEKVGVDGGGCLMGVEKAWQGEQRGNPW